MSEDLLVVELARQQYGLRVGRVREVIPRATITSLPGAPRDVLGVLSLRGTLLPVLDLRLRLGLPPVAARISQCVVVIRAERFTVGLLVDAVGEIVATRAAPVSNGLSLASGVVEQVTEINEKVVSILDADATVGVEVAAFLSAILSAGMAPPIGDALHDQQRDGKP